MARKVKFALEMADGTKVRNSIEELREHFDMQSVASYYLSGKLLEWLEDRYYDDEAAKIEELDKDSPNLNAQLCAIIGVDASDFDALDIEAVERLNEKKSILRQKTSDTSIIDNAMITALTQEDLADLLDLESPVIYLCGDKFNIPIRVEHKKYVGVLGTPKVEIRATSDEDLKKKDIIFENVMLPWNKVTSVNNNVGSNSDASQANSMVAPQPSGVKQELMEIKESIWGTSDIWQVVAHSGKPSNKQLTNVQKKIYINFVCNGAYSEEDIIHIYVVDDMSAGWAFTTDGFCVAGTIKEYFCGTIGSKQIDCLPYKDINKIEIDTDKPQETNILYINNSDYWLNCYYLKQDYNTNLSRNTLWRISKFLELSKTVATNFVLHDQAHGQMKSVAKSIIAKRRLVKAEKYIFESVFDAHVESGTIVMKNQKIGSLMKDRGLDNELVPIYAPRAGKLVWSILDGDTVPGRLMYNKEYIFGVVGDETDDEEDMEKWAQDKS